MASAAGFSTAAVPVEVWFAETGREVATSIAETVPEKASVPVPVPLSTHGYVKVAEAPGASDGIAGCAATDALAKPVVFWSGGLGAGATSASVPLLTFVTRRERLNAWPRESVAGIEKDSMRSWVLSSTVTTGEATSAALTAFVLFVSVPDAPAKNRRVPEEVPFSTKS